MNKARIEKLKNKYGLLLIFVVMVLFFSQVSETFLTSRNIGRILIGQTYVGVLALGAILILILGDFDISIGYMLGFVMMVGGFCAKLGYGTATIIIAMVLAGLGAGLVNGILIVKLKIKAPIATLGFGMILYGMTRAMSDGKVLSKNIPKLLINFSRGRLFGISLPVYVFIVLAVIMLYVLEKTPYGKKLYAVGGSERTAYLSGINTDMMRISAYVLTGLFVAITAIMLLGQAAGANPKRGPEYLMSTYAVVFLSVTVFRPGVYNVLGVILSLFLLGAGFNGLSLLGTPSWFENVFYGIVLVFSVLFANKEARKAIKN